MLDTEHSYSTHDTGRKKSTREKGKKAPLPTPQKPPLQCG